MALLYKQPLSFVADNLVGLDKRIAALEASSSADATFIRRTGSHDKSGELLIRLEARTTALENSSASFPIDFDPKKLSRSPLDRDILALHKRLVVLGG